jgi:hypothetical protein
MAFVIRGDADRQSVADMVRTLKDGMRVEIKHGRRSPEQSNLMWARLNDIATQVKWHGQELEPVDWKDMFTAGLRRARIVPNIDGDGFVQLGLHTSDLTKEEMSNLLDLMDAFAAQHGVTFKEFSESNSSDVDSRISGNQASDRADTPAGNVGPQPSPAGVTYTGEPSRLKPDWFDRYVMLLTKATNRAMSVLSRDEMALRELGQPNEWERDLQRRVATWVNKRDRNKITAQEFHDGISAIRAEWASVINSRAPGADAA